MQTWNVFVSIICQILTFPYALAWVHYLLPLLLLYVCYNHHEFVLLSASLPCGPGPWRRSAAHPLVHLGNVIHLSVGRKCNTIRNFQKLYIQIFRDHSRHISPPPNYCPQLSERQMYWGRIYVYTKIKVSSCFVPRTYTKTANHILGPPMPTTFLQLWRHSIFTICSPSIILGSKVNV